jgi:hypothetical protein
MPLPMGDALRTIGVNPLSMRSCMACLCKSALRGDRSGDDCGSTERFDAAGGVAAPSTTANRRRRTLDARGGILHATMTVIEYVCVCVCVCE